MANDLLKSKSCIRNSFDLVNESNNFTIAKNKNAFIVGNWFKN